MDRSFIEKSVSGHAAELIELSDKIWDYAELAFNEYKSSALHAKLLEENGFKVTCGIGGLDTAVLGIWGNGSPVVGFLGEYDALQDLSQESGVYEQKPIAGQNSGHGCGHHLLGAGSLGAAIALKEYMEQTGLKGTIRYYGCPAEESGAGKAFMAREGCFDGLDFALSWHPAPANFLFNQTLALALVSFKYTGISAHASGEPHKGRSALDAAELTSVGCNYLREHMVPGAKLHYAYQNAGSKATNIVHPEAQVHYTVRAPGLIEVKELLEQVCNVAKGAAMMTGTKVDIEVLSGYADFLCNKIMDEIMLENMEAFPLQYTAEEISQADLFKNACGMSKAPVSLLTNVIRKQIPASSSTDASDVSWITPMAQCGINCYSIGSTGHSWQYTAQGKTSYAHKGMLTASKVLAATAAQMMEEPELIKKAKEEQKAILNGRTYASIIPLEQKPCVNP